jgi:hypothetical protein
VASDHAILVRPKVSNSPGVGCIAAQVGRQRASGPQGVGGLRASGMAIVRIRATAGRWTRAGDCEDWSAACLTFLTLDAAERAQRPADESVLRRAPADRIVRRLRLVQKVLWESQNQFVMRFW